MGCCRRVQDFRQPFGFPCARYEKDDLTRRIENGKRQRHTRDEGRGRRLVGDRGHPQGPFVKRRREWKERGGMSVVPQSEQD